MQYNYLPVEMQVVKTTKWGQNRLRLLNPLTHPVKSLFLKTMISDYFLLSGAFLNQKPNKYLIPFPPPLPPPQPPATHQQSVLAGVRWRHWNSEYSSWNPEFHLPLESRIQVPLTKTGFPYMGRGIEHELLNKLNELAQLSVKQCVEVIKSVVFYLVVNLSCFFSLLM